MLSIVKLAFRACNIEPVKLKTYIDAACTDQESTSGKEGACSELEECMAILCGWLSQNHSKESSITVSADHNRLELFKDDNIIGLQQYLHELEGIFNICSMYFGLKPKIHKWEILCVSLLLCVPTPNNESANEFPQESHSDLDFFHYLIVPTVKRLRLFWRDIEGKEWTPAAWDLIMKLDAAIRKSIVLEHIIPKEQEKNKRILDYRLSVSRLLPEILSSVFRLKRFNFPNESSAAIKIQCVFRGFISRKQLAQTTVDPLNYISQCIKSYLCATQLRQRAAAQIIRNACKSFLDSNTVINSRSTFKLMPWERKAILTAQKAEADRAKKIRKVAAKRDREKESMFMRLRRRGWGSSHASQLVNSTLLQVSHAPAITSSLLQKKVESAALLSGANKDLSSRAPPHRPFTSIEHPNNCNYFNALSNNKSPYLDSYSSISNPPDLTAELTVMHEGVCRVLSLPVVPDAASAFHRMKPIKPEIVYPEIPLPMPLSPPSLINKRQILTKSNSSLTTSCSDSKFFSKKKQTSTLLLNSRPSKHGREVVWLPNGSMEAKERFLTRRNIQVATKANVIIARAIAPPFVSNPVALRSSASVSQCAKTGSTGMSCLLSKENDISSPKKSLLSITSKIESHCRLSPSPPRELAVPVSPVRSHSSPRPSSYDDVSLVRSLRDWKVNSWTSWVLSRSLPDGVKPRKVSFDGQNDLVAEMYASDVLGLTGLVIDEADSQSSENNKSCRSLWSLVIKILSQPLDNGWSTMAVPFFSLSSAPLGTNNRLTTASTIQNKISWVFEFVYHHPPESDSSRFMKGVRTNIHPYHSVAVFAVRLFALLASLYKTKRRDAVISAKSVLRRYFAELFSVWTSEINLSSPDKDASANHKIWLDPLQGRFKITDPLTEAENLMNMKLAVCDQVAIAVSAAEAFRDDGRILSIPKDWKPSLPPNPPVNLIISSANSSLFSDLEGALIDVCVSEAPENDNHQRSHPSALPGGVTNFVSMQSSSLLPLPHDEKKLSLSELPLEEWKNLHEQAVQSLGVSFSPSLSEKNHSLGMIDQNGRESQKKQHFSFHPVEVFGDVDKDNHFDDVGFDPDLMNDNDDDDSGFGTYDGIDDVEIVIDEDGNVTKTRKSFSIADINDVSMSEEIEEVAVNAVFDSNDFLNSSYNHFEDTEESFNSKDCNKFGILTQKSDQSPCNYISNQHDTNVDRIVSTTRMASIKNSAKDAISQIYSIDHSFTSCQTLPAKEEEEKLPAHVEATAQNLESMLHANSLKGRPVSREMIRRKIEESTYHASFIQQGRVGATSLTSSRQNLWQSLNTNSTFSSPSSSSTRSAHNTSSTTNDDNHNAEIKGKNIENKLHNIPSQVSFPPLVCLKTPNQQKSDNCMTSFTDDTKKKQTFGVETNKSSDLNSLPNPPALIKRQFNLKNSTPESLCLSTERESTERINIQEMSLINSECSFNASLQLKDEAVKHNFNSLTTKGGPLLSRPNTSHSVSKLPKLVKSASTAVSKAEEKKRLRQKLVQNQLNLLQWETQKHWKSSFGGLWLAGKQSK